MTLKEFILRQPWWGKLLGCFFGYLILGSVGGLFGLLIGHAFDNGLFHYFSRVQSAYQRERRPVAKRIFIESTFSVMGFLAKADGFVTESELSLARLAMQELELDRSAKNLAKRSFNAGKNSTFVLDTELIKLKSICANHAALLNLFLDYQYRIVKIDGLTATKIKLLNRIFGALGYAPFQSQRAFYADLGGEGEGAYTYSHRSTSSQSASYMGISSCYAELGVSESATKNEVKQAYRRLISRHHPDKLMSQGASPEKIKQANERVQALTKNYDKINAYKGW